MKTAKTLLAVLLCFALLSGGAGGLVSSRAAQIYDIAAGETATVHIETPGETVYFRFTPEETGHYRFFSEEPVDDVNARLYESDMELIQYNDDGGVRLNFRIDATLTAGKTYYYTARYNSDAKTGSFPVKLVRITDETFAVTPKDDVYSFRASPGDTLTLKVEVDSGMGGAIAYSWYRSEYPDDKTLIEGETGPSLTLENLAGPGQYSCRAADEYGFYGDVSFYVYCFADRPIALNTETTVTVETKGETAYFCFTPEETGLYRFFSNEPVDDVQAWLYDADMGVIQYNDDGGVRLNFKIDATLTAGETYYYAAKYNSNDKTGSFPVKLVRMTDVSFTAAPKNGVSSFRVSPGDDLTFEVEATSGMGGAIAYSWYRSEYPDDRTLIEGETGPSLTLENLQGPGQYSCRAADEYGSYGDVSFYVYCFADRPITLNAETLVNVETKGESVTFRFVPEETAVYSFYSMEPVEDVQAWLYDANMGLIQYNDDGGVRLNFKIDATLTAGETYYYAARYNSSQRTGSFPVYLTLPKENGFSAERATDEFAFVRPGDTPTFAVTAECLQGGLHYYWKNNGTGEFIIGENGPSLTLPAVTKGYEYVCIVNDDYGNSAEVTFEAVNLDAIVYEWNADRTACFAVYGDATPPIAEEGTVTSETTPPTCTEYGVSVAVAAFTNPRFKSQLLKEAIEPTGHAYGDPIYEWSEDLSTCTAKVVCAYDEKHVISETAQSKYAVTKKPTCTDQGEGTYTVGFNNKRFYGQTKTVVIDPLGHDYVDHEAQAPTCSAVGWDAYRTCTRCDYTTYKERPIDPDAHEFTVTVVAPTCVDTGYTSHACKYCRFGYADAETPALGHDLAAVEAVAPTVSAPGNIAHYACARCGALFADAEGKTPVTAEDVDLPALTAVPGDVDGDGKVTAADARLALRCAVGLETYAPGSPQYAACDVDGTPGVTAADARLILRKAVGFEDPEWKG
ncbi:MAG: dockerin type I repeat-containing protein [Clostridia bacterium]|nr:dockerin type I repeat-containing protein [Clostridia bacterium]